MQVDVVEAQSAAMFERLGKASNFGDAESAHAAFLAALLEQTLLTSPRVAKSLETIYGLCTRLCSLVQVCTGIPCLWLLASGKHLVNSCCMGI